MTDVGRVIARPFLGTNTKDFYRTTNRKDLAVVPEKTMLDRIKNAGKTVWTIGKISDIFCDQGITKSQKTKHNIDGIEKTIQAIGEHFEGLIFTNLIDFDMEYGHRRDVLGYQKSLIEFDNLLLKIQEKMKESDLLIITADHGNDPTFKGNDHTREYVPILIWNKNIVSADIGQRSSFTDIAATIEDILLKKSAANSFAKQIMCG
jgi:phosphopentomutase